jgi:hypothetical protein
MNAKRELWTSVLVWILSIAGLAVAWVWFIENGQKPLTLPLFSLPEMNDGVAPSAGIRLDGLALLMSSLALWVGASSFFFGNTQAMVTLATFGAALAWLSSTLWLSLTGCALAALAGFLSFRDRWEEDDGSSSAVQYAKEKCCGLLIAFLGLSVWSANTSLAGGYALLAGTWFLLPAFPFLGGIASESEPGSAENLVTQRVLPALAAAAVFVRFVPASAASVDVLSILGWVGLGMAFLAALYGLVSEGWKTALSAWIAASGSIAVTILAFAFDGSRNGVLYFAGVVLSAAAMSAAGSALEKGTSQPGWAKAGALLGALLGTSFAGFITAKPVVAMLSHAWRLDEPSFVAFLAFPFFVASVLLWKVLWSLFRLSAAVNAKAKDFSWQNIVFPLPLAITGLGVLWTGELSGGLDLNSVDQVMRSMSDALLGVEPSASRPDDAIWNTALAVYGGVILFSAVAGYWLSGTKDRWLTLRSSFPKFTSFVDQGVGASIFAVAVLRLLRATGEKVSHFVDVKIWEHWIPTALAASVRMGGGLVARADGTASLRISRGLRRKAEIPSKLLQLIQNGDVQWYLMFALTAGMAMLAHFMRKG